jgi:hypothetical protein
MWGVPRACTADAMTVEDDCAAAKVRSTGTLIGHVDYGNTCVHVPAA